MRRLLAVLAAVAMVAGALLVRGRMEAPGGPTDPSAPGQVVDATQGDPSADVRLLCVPELADACAAIAQGADGQVAVRVEAAGSTLARLGAGAAADVDAWLTLDPWPAMVDGDRQRAGQQPLFDPAPAVVGRSPLVLAVWAEREAVLTASCPDGVTWRCAGEVAGRDWGELGGEATWGAVKPGHGDPTASASGLLVTGAAAASFFGRADLSTRDYADDAFRDWFTRLERAVPAFAPSAGTAVEQMVLFGPASFDIAGTTEAEAGPLLARAAGRRGSLRLLPVPAAASAVLAVVPGQPGAAAAARLVADGAVARAVAATGWRVEGQPAAPGVGEVGDLPPADALPSAGALRALQTVWQEIVR